MLDLIVYYMGLAFECEFDVWWECLALKLIDKAVELVRYSFH